MGAVNNQKRQHSDEPSENENTDAVDTGSRNSGSREKPVPDSRDKKLFRCLVGKSNAMQQVRHEIEQVAVTDDGFAVLPDHEWGTVDRIDAGIGG